MKKLSIAIVYSMIALILFVGCSSGQSSAAKKIRISKRSN